MKLIVDNRLSTKTCKRCSFYDVITSQCGIYKGIKHHNMAEKCKSYSESSLNFELIEEEFTAEFDEFDDDFFNFIFQGEKDIEDDRYPFEPSVPSMRDDATWFVSPCKTYGCWIINEKKIGVVPTIKNKNLGKSYVSPIPLHDHHASKGIRNNICWYVDRHGKGQYVLLINGKIKMLS